MYSCILLFQIYYEPATGVDTSIKSIDTTDNITSFTITGLMPATNYTVYLTAITGAGEGNISVKITNFTKFDGKLFSCMQCVC